MKIMLKVISGLKDNCWLKVSENEGNEMGLYSQAHMEELGLCKSWKTFFSITEEKGESTCVDAYKFQVFI